MNTRDVVKTFALRRHVNAETVVGFTHAAFHAFDLRDETLPLLRDIVQRFESVVRLQPCDQQWAETFEARMESGVE